MAASGKVYPTYGQVYPQPEEPPAYSSDGDGTYKNDHEPPATTVIYVTSGEPYQHENVEMAGNSFSDKKIRNAFIRKVYLLLLVQLSITVGVICLFIFCEPVKIWIQTNSWVYWTSYGVFVVTYITLACCPAVRRRVPVNFICLFIFTLALSYMAATISRFLSSFPAKKLTSAYGVLYTHLVQPTPYIAFGLLPLYYDTTIVLVCIGITAGMCLGITLFAVQTKIDFTLCAGFLFVLILILMYSGLTCLIFYLCGYYYYMSCLYGALAAFVFSMFLVYDTQLVVGGKHRRYELSPEEYITGALELYLDIVYLLIIMIGLFGNR